MEMFPLGNQGQCGEGYDGSRFEVSMDDAVPTLACTAFAVRVHSAMAILEEWSSLASDGATVIIDCILS